MPNDEVEQVKEALLRRNTEEPVRAEDLLGTGSRVLNCVCSGNVHGAFPKGEYVWFVGDSNSGKTWYTINAFAEAAHNPAFDDYSFMYNGPEGGALMDVVSYFGEKTADRLQYFQTPTVEEFYWHATETCKKPTIYALDSMDSLTSLSEGKKFDENKNLHRKGKELKGSYGDGKAKVNSSGIRQLLVALRESKSILIVINQTRDDIREVPMPGASKTYSGGRALRFYACIEMWTSKTGDIEKSHKGKRISIGTNSRVKVRRTRLTGMNSFKVDIPILQQTGIDDTGACVDFLVDWGYWKKTESTGNITASELGIKAKREELIREIQRDNQEDDLTDVVQMAWNDIMANACLERKKKYD